MIMTRKMILVASAAIVAVAAVCGAYASNVFAKADALFDSNVEALTRRETSPKCTGPKKSNFVLQVFCHCTNESPCSDDRGC